MLHHAIELPNSFNINLQNISIVGKIRTIIFINRKKIIPNLGTTCQRRIFNGTIFSYIDNVLSHHFKEFEEEIIKNYNENNKDIF